MANQRFRLLIADDDKMSLFLMRQILSDIADIDTAIDGREALLFIEEYDYDLVILDIMMPIMTGLDILQVIRSRKDIAALPVILVSGISDQQKIAWGIRMGANDFLSKPLDTNILHARVSTQLRLKQLHDERNHLINKLQSANQVKTRMMQIASHDLKNPLNNLKMLTTIMLKEARQHEKLSKMLGMQTDSIDTMVGVINDFLDSTVSHTDELTLQINPLNSNPLIRQVLSQYSVAAKMKDISLRVNNIEGYILADERRLTQVIGNLVSNAIKYSPRDSNVYIYAEIDVEAQLWRLNIEDSGNGIPEEEQQYLFKPFSKEHISTEPTDGEASTGLGLWIVSEMINIQGGRVGMLNTDNYGACFWVELPLAPEESDATV
ncbi:MAG: hypothetical protein Phog2KO_34730 [Phototrophicaceae bacterium]